MLTPETVLQGRYHIVRQLGQGGMGAVYEAVDQRLDTTVALKETLFTEERLRKQFEREARLLARLHHPALPRVSDHFSEGDGQFLVMQYIPGDDLSEMMTRKRGPFPANQVLTWADQLLDALDYLHTQDPQIVHRDIKPQNLKITSRGQIILLDFGLAKGQSGEISRVTTSASIFGYTPNYAPLEQIQGLGTDTRSDLYSLGATLYHLMTAVKPPDALTRAAAVVNGQPDPLLNASEANSAVGAEVDHVLAKAMAQNRDQRYATAADMRKALHSAQPRL
jgi:serine/threonine protein kinase